MCSCRNFCVNFRHVNSLTCFGSFQMSESGATPVSSEVLADDRHCCLSRRSSVLLHVTFQSQCSKHFIMSQLLIQWKHLFRSEGLKLQKTTEHPTFAGFDIVASCLFVFLLHPPPHCDFTSTSRLAKIMVGTVDDDL